AVYPRPGLPGGGGPGGRARPSRFVAVPLTAGPGGAGPTAPAARHLVVEWPFGRPEPRTYWVTALPVHRLPGTVALAELRGTVAADCARLHREYGLGDFEGRSFRGWHHHVTLASAALGYDLLRGMEGSRGTGDGPAAH
ncbi:hypothetical protein ACFV6F_36070, partial [Kitasatospora phosalacinea]